MPASANINQKHFTDLLSLLSHGIQITVLPQIPHRMSSHREIDRYFTNTLYQLSQQLYFNRPLSFGSTSKKHAVSGQHTLLLLVK